MKAESNRRFWLEAPIREASTTLNPTFPIKSQVMDRINTMFQADRTLKCDNNVVSVVNTSFGSSICLRV